MKKNLLFLLFLILFVFNSTSQSLDWVVTMGQNNPDSGRSLTIDNSNNIYTIGIFSNTVDFDPGIEEYYLTSEGSFDIFIQKLDPEGNLIWAKSIGGLGFDEGKDIEVDALGNIFFTGTFQDTVDFDPNIGVYNLISNGSTDIFVQKLNPEGELIWAKSMGGTSFDEGSDITLSNTSLYLTGSFQDTVDFNPSPNVDFLISEGDNDVFIQKLNLSGELIWVRSMGSEFNDEGTAILVDNLENIFVAGHFKGTLDFDLNNGINNITSNGNSDLFLQKIDSESNLIWAKTIGGTSGEQLFDLEIDNAGNIYSTGFFLGSVDFDPNPEIFTLNSGNALHAFVLKLNTNGNFIWAKNMGGESTHTFGKSIAVDELGNIITAGGFTGTADFDPNSNIMNFSSNGDEDIFIQILDSIGDLIWIGTFGGDKLDQVQSVHLDNSTNLVLTGLFQEVVDFDLSQEINNSEAVGSSDIFIQKLTLDELVGITNIKPSKITLYPNPNNGKFYLEFQEIFSLNIKIIDSMGKNVYQNYGYNSTEQIDLSNLSNGLYYLRMIINNNEIQSKVIIIH